MASFVPHCECGMSTMTYGSASSQLVYNALTGESVTVELSVPMVLFHQWYDLTFDDDGWALLKGVDDSGNDKTIVVSDLPFTKVAIFKNKRVRIQDNSAKTISPWLDLCIAHRKSQTFTLSDTEALVFVTFNHERGILESRLQYPHLSGGKRFWELRRVRKSLKLTHGIH